MKKSTAVEIIETLKKTYPEAKCSLNYSSPFELLIAVMLSAQCTDERVNKVTPNLFKVCNTPESVLKTDLKKIERIIQSCGFYKNKAKNIKATSKILVEQFHSNVPNTIEELTSLPGVGRKTANVVMLEAFNNPQGVAVDTHVKRITNRIGLSKNNDPEKIEKDILKIFPKKYYTDINHTFIYHGRNTCTARNPNCNSCTIKSICKYNLKNV